MNLALLGKQQSDFAAALSHARQGRDIIKALCDKAPDYPGFARDLTNIDEVIAELEP